MWELIQANKRKSVVLFSGMAVCLLLLGYLIGIAVEPVRGGMIGFFIAFLIWIVMSLASYYSGSSILLAANHAREVSHEIHPQLFNIVEEMKIAANLPVMPKIYVIDDAAPNAFAAGRDSKHSSIAVTAGLLSKLNRDELQGVIAHEMSHIMNRDILFMTCAGVLLGSITLISQVFFRGTLRVSNTSGRNFVRYRVRGRGSAITGGQGQAILVLIAVLFAVLAPILARLFYFALSRKREYLADASGVRLTRYPEGLASALEKIASSEVEFASANKIAAPMYIMNPFQKEERQLNNLTSTHPPIAERIQILRSMSQGVNFADYQKAFSSVKGRPSTVIPPSGLKEMGPISIRQASSELSKPKEAKDQARDLGDLLRAVNQFTFLTCTCGLRFKVPPDFRKSKVMCPKCWKELTLPSADQKVAATEKGAATGVPLASLEYARKGNGWETFTCSCGNSLQLSPLFSGTHLACQSCRRSIEIKSL